MPRVNIRIIIKGFFVISILAGIGAAWYYTPARHHQAAKGTYFLRQYISFTTSKGVTGWLPGREIHKFPDAPLVPGSKTVTDGTFTAVVPEAILTQDIEDAEAIRLADNTALDQVQDSVAAPTVPSSNQEHSAQAGSTPNSNQGYIRQITASGVGGPSTIYHDHPAALGAGSSRLSALSQTASR